MNNDLIDNKLMNTDIYGVQNNSLQTPNIYNEFIKQKAFVSYNEIRENLSKAIQLGELESCFRFSPIN